VTGDWAIPIQDERRRIAIMTFLGAGLVRQPSRAQAVAALSAARRQVASFRARSESVRQWLAVDVHRRGIRENAAILAVLEVPDFRDEVARAYALDHPDRLSALEDMLAALTWVRHPLLPPGVRGVSTGQDHSRGPDIMKVMSKSPSRRFPVTVAHLPVTRCQICYRTVAYRPGNLSEALTEHYRRAYPEALDLASR
jgi:hypothetical protein